MNQVKIRIYYIWLIIVFQALGPLAGQKVSFDFKNQISSWIGVNYTDQTFWQTGARYIPALGPAWNAGKGNKIDAELSVNTYGNLFFKGQYFDTATYDFKPYRLWMRYSTSNLEIRAGLQKINFGSSNIFRPLMWFDRMDFRDPLQLTDGVYGLLGRYYFNNNANIWLWTLYGNDKIKGWEVAPSVPTIPEYGGRVQLPVPKGEIAVSYHHRIADYSEFYTLNPSVPDPRFSENLIAADGKWDLGIGLWFEYVLKLNDKENQIMTRRETYYSLGADYTFDIGNGLNLITEFFHYSNDPDETQQKNKSNFSSFSLNYPFTLSHSLACFINYNWDTGEWYRYLNLQLKYDYISLYIMTFWNPDKFTLFTSREDSNSFAGKGFQIMLVLDI